MQHCHGFWLKIPIETRIKIINWIRKHLNVIQSPLRDDTLLVPNPTGTPKNILNAKLLSQVPVRELHNNLYYPMMGLGDLVIDEDGNHLVLGTVFCASLMNSK